MVCVDVRHHVYLLTQNPLFFFFFFFFFFFIDIPRFYSLLILSNCLLSYIMISLLDLCLSVTRLMLSLTDLAKLVLQVSRPVTWVPASPPSCSLKRPGHAPRIAFRHLPPNSARFSYATEGALFISAQLSSDAVSALRKVWVLIRLWKQPSAQART